MILSIDSSLSSFKKVTFREGLNVLLSDKNSASTAKQTRNSAGKTSLVEIIHFLYGADCDKDSLFRAPELIDHKFRGHFRIGSKDFIVERGGSEPAKIFLLAGGETGRTFQKNSTRQANGSTSPIPTGRPFLATTYSACQRTKVEPYSKRRTRRVSVRCSLTSHAGATQAALLAQSDRPRSSIDLTGRSTCRTS